MAEKALHIGTGGDGLQLLFTSGNIATGSFVRVVGWP
jgi:hypothetical protein